MASRQTKTAITVAIIAALSAIVVALIGNWEPKLLPSTQPGKGNLVYTGRVVDEKTSQPISDAKVSFEVQGVPPIIYTDQEGIFRFDLVAGSALSARIRVDASGYNVYTRRLELNPSNVALEDIRLSKKDESKQEASPPKVVPAKNNKVAPQSPPVIPAIILLRDCQLLSNKKIGRQVYPTLVLFQGATYRVTSDGWAHSMKFEEGQSLSARTRCNGQWKEADLAVGDGSCIISFAC